MMQDVLVWMVLGAAIGAVARVVSTRTGSHPWYVDAVLGSFVAVFAGEAFFATGGNLVDHLNVFTIDPIAFYAVLAAAAAVFVFFIGLDLALGGSTRIQARRQDMKQRLATLGESARVTRAYAESRSR